MGDVDKELRLEIDQFNLDKEWIGQPKLYYEWAVKHTDAMLMVDQAKSSLEVVKATLDADIRKEPQAHGLAKITETVVEMAIARSETYQVSVSKLNRAKHAANIVAAAVAALDQRKRALEKLVDLQGRHYFAEPKASPHNREVVMAMEKRAIRSKSKKKKDKESKQPGSE